ncbi:MAG: hypothetical protein ACLQK4_03085 [Acidimicrobiales bacterium]
MPLPDTPPEDRSAPDRSGAIPISRRTLLGGSAASAIAAYVGSLSHTPVGRYLDGVATRLVTELPALPRETPQSQGPVYTFALERDSDLLLLDMTFYEFTLDTTSDPVALVANNAENLIYVFFPPQAIGEGAYPYPPKLKGPEFDAPPILSVLSGYSYLVFTVESGQTIPLPTMTVDDLLDWSAWTLLVQDTANVGSRSAPSYPSGTVCMIECPYGLYLTPVVNPSVTRNGLVTTYYETNFVGTVQPTTSDGVTECWSAQLSYSQVTEILGTSKADDIEGPHDISSSRSAPRAASASRPEFSTGGTTPLTPLVAAMWCRDITIYDDINSTTAYPTWNQINNKKYDATPPGFIQIPTDE